MTEFTMLLNSNIDRIFNYVKVVLGYFSYTPKLKMKKPPCLERGLKYRSFFMDYPRYAFNAPL
jgi:hypothetical protein